MKLKVTELVNNSPHPLFLWNQNFVAVFSNRQCSTGWNQSTVSQTVHLGLARGLFLRSFQSKISNEGTFLIQSLKATKPLCLALLLTYPTNIKWREQIIKLLIRLSSPASCYFNLHTSKYCLQHSEQFNKLGQNKFNKISCLDTLPQHHSCTSRRPDSELRVTAMMTETRALCSLAGSYSSSLPPILASRYIQHSAKH